MSMNYRADRFWESVHALHIFFIVTYKWTFEEVYLSFLFLKSDLVGDYISIYPHVLDHPRFRGSGWSSKTSHRPFITCLSTFTESHHTAVRCSWRGEVVGEVARVVQRILFPGRNTYDLTSKMRRKNILQSSWRS